MNPWISHAIIAFVFFFLGCRFASRVLKSCLLLHGRWVYTHEMDVLRLLVGTSEDPLPLDQLARAFHLEHLGERKVRKIIADLEKDGIVCTFRENEGNSAVFPRAMVRVSESARAAIVQRFGA